MNPVQLKKITISGFKSISSIYPLTIELGDINILLGTNGSGKSNIISFFKMLNFMMSGSFQLFVEKAGTSQVFLHYGTKYTEVIKGLLCFESDTDIDQYKFELTHATPDRLIIKSEEVLFQKDEKESIIIPLESDFKESALTHKTTNKTIQVIHKILTDCKVYQFHNSSAESPIRRSCRIEYSDYLQSEGNNLSSFLYDLKKNYAENYNKIRNYVRRIIPHFNDFYLEPNDRGYVMLRWTDISPNLCFRNSFRTDPFALLHWQHSFCNPKKPCRK